MMIMQTSEVGETLMPLNWECVCVQVATWRNRKCIHGFVGIHGRVC